MENRTSLYLQQRNLLLFLVVVGYILTFITAARGEVQYSVWQVVTGILFGVVYLILGLFDAELLRRFPVNTRNIIYFFTQCLLAFGIGWVLGPGGNWLIGLPLASLAVERLSPRWRWAVYIGILSLIILPILRYSTLETAFMNTLFISPAIFFIAVVTQVKINEQHARENAETLTKQLETANRQLAEYASQAEELAATQERNRLAREIHDNMGHYLTIINVQLEAARVTLNSEPVRTMDALGKAQELTRKALSSVRESVAALRVSPVENRSLENAIAGLVDESRSYGIPIHFSVIGESRLVGGKSGLAFYRAAQEGLTNACKHSRASCIDVELDFSKHDTIRLMVRDNGVGAADVSGGFGLIGIRERVHLLGGEFKLETQPDQGFCIEVILPVDSGDDL